MKTVTMTAGVAAAAAAVEVEAGHVEGAEDAEVVVGLVVVVSGPKVEGKPKETNLRTEPPSR